MEGLDGRSPLGRTFLCGCFIFICYACVAEVVASERGKTEKHLKKRRKKNPSCDKTTETLNYRGSIIRAVDFARVLQFTIVVGVYSSLLVRQ